MTPPLEEPLHPVLDELVSLYAKHGVAGVQASLAFQDLCDAQAGDPDFDAQRMSVERAQARLEKRLAGQLPHEQVIQALRQMRRPAAVDSKRVYRELVTRGFARKWSPAQRTYFNAAVEKVQQWDDYFLSFTAHNPSHPNPSLLNVNYQMLIWIGVRREITLPEGAERNLVAELLNVRLHDEGLRGYFYPDQREDGDITQALTREASQCLAFVQLVEPTLFQRYPNYCQLEFEAASLDPSRGLVFILTRPYADFEAVADAVDDRLADWYDVLMSRQGVPFLAAPTAEAALEALKLIKDQIATRIRDAAERLYDGVPV
jgi:hypothetical protein